MRISHIDKAIDALEKKRADHDAAIQLAIDELNAQRPKARTPKPRIVKPKAPKGETA